MIDTTEAPKVESETVAEGENITGDWLLPPGPPYSIWDSRESLVVRYRLLDGNVTDWFVDFYFKPPWRIRFALWCLGFKAEWHDV